MSKFKVDEAKTVGGYEAVIFEITGSKIFGKAYIGGGWIAMSWLPDGVYNTLARSDYDLLSNVELLRHEFHTRALIDYHYSSSKVFVEIPLNFNTKKVHVVITEVFE